MNLPCGEVIGDEITFGRGEILEAIVEGIPHVAEAVEDVPAEQLWRALEAAESNYWRTLRQSGFRNPNAKRGLPQSCDA